MEYFSPLLFLYVLHLYLTSCGFALARFSYSMNMCVCVCVFNNICVLERATYRPTPTERWCVVYDFSRESRFILSFSGMSGRDMRTAATPAPDQPGPPKAPPSPSRASRPKQSAPLQRIGAAFMPGQSGRDLSVAPALKGEADSRVMVASSVQLTVGSM